MRRGVFLEEEAGVNLHEDGHNIEDTLDIKVHETGAQARNWKLFDQQWWQNDLKQDDEFGQLEHLDFL